MKNIICPISKDKVQSHIPRTIGFMVVSLVLSYVITGNISFLIILILDFLARALDLGKYSILSHLSISASKLLGIKSNTINKAQKIFAARLGLIMFTLAFIFHLSGHSFTANIITLLVSVLATLEFAFNYCVGCIIYSLIVYPLFVKN